MPMVISLGYGDLVLSSEDGVEMLKLLEKAERYQKKYWGEEARKARNMGEDSYTYHVYPNETQYQVQLISEGLYNMAKLAGAPEKE